jgi:Ca2+-binding EF-hand superfamily protein
MSAASKIVTKAERVTWMSKTSDIVGSHLKTDLDSYLTLIRRKIQEKCETTHELITLIRRSKIGDSKFVTPNEFRFTLIKFGVIIAQSLVDIIFNVFDTDRSGSMDFDEFAMWIMNSEFKPTVTSNTRKLINVESPEESLRKKLAICIQANEDVFLFMKKKISFVEFVSEINRKNMKLTDVEARQIFLKFDPENTGFVDTGVLVSWGRSGIVPEKERKPDHSAVTPALPQCINIVSVRNSKQMEKCFSHIPEGAGVRIPFEEFRRCLVQGGLGKNALDCRDLFLALGGDLGTADIDSLFRACKKMHLPENPKDGMTNKPLQPSYVNVSRAARRLRDAMRKVFNEVKAEIISKDVSGSGYISAQDLHQIMVKHAMPITFQDFRYIVQQLHTEDGGSRIDWRSFLHMYNPRRVQHALSLTSLPEMDSRLSAPQPSSRINGGAADGNNNNNAADTLMALSGNFASSSGSKQLRPMTSADSFGNSSRARRVGTASTEFGQSTDLRKMWQISLRICHKADPDRTGLVNRVSFIQALEAANVGNVS